MNPPANWYPDPTGRHGQRYWDGEQWTEHVFTDGVQGVDPLEVAAATSATTDPDADVETSEAGAGADAAGTDGAHAPGDGDGQSTDDPGSPVQGSGLFDPGAGDSTAATEPAEDAGTTAQGAEADESAPEPEWTPTDDQPSPAEDADVAPEVQADDVVGSLDEVAEAVDTDTAEPAAAGVPDVTAQTEDSDGDAADAPHDAAEEAAEAVPGGAPEEAAADTAEDAPTSDEDTAAGEATVSDDEVSTPAGDFSDAFMVTPETVSRLVSRQATAAPPEPTPDEAEEDAPAADEAAPEPSESADDDVATPGDDTAGAIDAPPPSMPEPAPAATTPPAAAPAATTDGGGLGITGDLVGGAFAEREESGPVALQNSRLLRCSLSESSGVIARQGTMVAYQGDVSFERQGAGGVTRALKRAATGEGLAMMRAGGPGDVFFADGAQHVFLLNLEGGPGLSVNGRNVLAFDAALQWDIERVKGATLLAGGLFNTTLTGTGWVALVSDGEPVVLRTDEAPTFVDVNALVAWSSGLSTTITNTVSAKSLVGLGSGEAFQMAFEGTGIVIVQPSEGPMGGAAAS